MRAMIAVILAGIALVGCGGGAAPHRQSAPPTLRPTAPVSLPAHRPRSPRVRWLVRTVGAPPSVAAENRARGSRGWRLPGPAADVGGLAFGDIHGYPSRETIAPGQREQIFVNAPGARKVRIRIFRMGFYGGIGGREVFRTGPLAAHAQPGCRHVALTGLTTCHWHPTLTLRIPSALPSGVYIVRMDTRSAAADCLFVVTALRPPPLLAMLPTATYEAYNAWGGDSLYPGGTDRVVSTGTTQGVAVSLRRPYDSVTGAGQFFARDVAMVRFLERYRYPVSYTTSEGLDAHPGEALGRRALLDFGHSEYWSQHELDAFASARSRGTSLVFLSSDTATWRIRFRGATIVGYKEHSALDPDRRAATGPTLASTAALIGTRYTGCITPRLRIPGPPEYRLYPWAPSPELRPAWLFRGSGLTPRATVAGIVGYELDAISAFTPQRVTVVGDGNATCMAESEYEGAQAIPPLGLGRTTSTLSRTSRGAWVFSSGTLSWELGLEPVPSASPDAPRAPEHAIVQITRNLLARVLGAR